MLLAASCALTSKYQYPRVPRVWRSCGELPDGWMLLLWPRGHAALTPFAPTLGSVHWCTAALRGKTSRGSCSIFRRGWCFVCCGAAADTVGSVAHLSRSFQAPSRCHAAAPTSHSHSVAGSTRAAAPTKTVARGFGSSYLVYGTGTTGTIGASGACVDGAGGLVGGMVGTVQLEACTCACGAGCWCGGVVQGAVASRIVPAAYRRLPTWRVGGSDLPVRGHASC